MVFGHENTLPLQLYVDLGDLQSEKEHLANFIPLHLKVTVSEAGDKLKVTSEGVSVQELYHVVNKFVYHRDLNNTHWVSIEGTTVIINRIKGNEKKEKHEKEPPHETAAQSWGL